jgi:hypothetical protein
MNALTSEGTSAEGGLVVAAKTLERRPAQTRKISAPAAVLKVSVIFTFVKSSAEASPLQIKLSPKRLPGNQRFRQRRWSAVF